MLNHKETELDSDLVHFIEVGPRVAGCVLDKAEWVHKNDVYVGFRLKSQAERFGRLALMRKYTFDVQLTKAKHLKGCGIRWEVRLAMVPQPLMSEIGRRDMQDFAAEQAMSKFFNQCISKGSLAKAECKKLLDSMRDNGSLFEPIIRCK